jgi:ribosomal protein S18 acetylase RimI-like enzyme
MSLVHTRWGRPDTNSDATSLKRAGILVDLGPQAATKVHAPRLARRDADGTILGAAIWEAPGHRISLSRQLAELPAFARALGWRGLVAAMRLQSRLAAYRPAEPHWYLAQIGVGGQARGTGVGSALLKSRLGVIDSMGLPVYLESSNEKNRGLYRRMGFSSIATISGVPDASPTAMWRAPGAAASDTGVRSSGQGERDPEMHPGEIDRALWQERTLAKTWIMRGGTLHLVPADELEDHVRSMAGQIAAGTAGSPGASDVQEAIPGAMVSLVAAHDLL